jgi:HK97 family phage major capsid protein
MADVSGTEIDLLPTAGMRAEAKRYQDWKTEGRPGGTEVAARRARQILSGNELSPDTVVTMAAWFARHEVDKEGQGFSPDEDGYPSPGRVAWAAWGGDPGQRWSTAKGKAIQKAQAQAAADGRSMLASRSVVATVDVRQLNSQPLRRQLTIDVASATRSEDPAAADVRTFEFPFSSEEPVDRWFGPEVLSHDAAAVDLTRLNDGAPLLWNHDPDRVLGVIERGWIDDGRGRVRVRFARNAFAEEMLADVRDRILRNVSVGYTIEDARPLTIDGRDGVMATRWQPLEISLVSIPADPTVGIGRSLDPTTPVLSPPPPMDQQQQTTPDLDAVRAQAAADERSRVASITSLCREHGADALAQDLIESGASEADAMRQVLSQLATRAKQPQQMASAASGRPAAQPIATGTGADIGLTQREVQQFSFLRAMRAQLMPNERSVWEAAAFERDVSAAVATRMGMAPKGLLVPNEVLNTRTLTAGNSASAGDLIMPDARPEAFIELLRRRNVLTGLGITLLTGLVGPVTIPRQTGSGQAYWVGEQGEALESDLTVGQINMTSKTMSAFTRFSRTLMMQSSIDVENLVREDLAIVMALEQARTTLYGTGTSNQPLGLKFVTGINTVDFAANQPTYPELVSMETAVAADDADIGTMAYATNATLYGGFKTTSKSGTDAIFVLEPGGTVNGYNAVRSNQVETGDVFFGVWSQVIMGLWGALDLQVNPYSEDRAGNIRVVVHQSCDIAVRHPGAFCRGNNTL